MKKVDKNKPAAPSHASVAPTAEPKAAVNVEIKKPLTIDDLGWTTEQAIEIRARLSSFAEDWDDPAMDIYDDL